jgi:hypothetical protein
MVYLKHFRVDLQRRKWQPQCELLYQDREPTLEIASAGLPWSFDADGANFRSSSEAKRIRMAYLFDLLLAVHTSWWSHSHQITAVYGEMLPPSNVALSLG